MPRGKILRPSGLYSREFLQADTQMWEKLLRIASFYPLPHHVTGPLSWPKPPVLIQWTVFIINFFPFYSSHTRIPLYFNSFGKSLVHFVLVLHNLPPLVSLVSHSFQRPLARALDNESTYSESYLWNLFSSPKSARLLSERKVARASKCKYVLIIRTFIVQVLSEQGH